MGDFDEPLSSAGQERRELILGLAKSQARRRRRRRQVLQMGAVCAVLGVAVSLVLLSKTSGLHSSETTVVVGEPDLLPLSVVRSSVIITFVQTDPTISERLSVSAPHRWTIIDDDQLLNSLAEAGHSGGLIRLNDREILMLK
jgi:hypothetical protein